MIGKAGSVQRRKHACAECEVVRVGEVVGNVGGGELMAGKKVAAVVAACARSQSNEIKLIHLAPVHTLQCGGPSMVDVVFVAVGSPPLWHHLPGGKFAGFRAVLSIEGAEHIVVGAILFDKKDDVADFLDTGGSSLLLPKRKREENEEKCKQENTGQSGAAVDAHRTILGQRAIALG